MFESSTSIPTALNGNSLAFWYRSVIIIPCLMLMRRSKNVMLIGGAA